MAKNTCPGIIRIGGHPRWVSVVKDSVRLSPVNPHLISLRYAEGIWKYMKKIPKRAQKEAFIHRARIFLWPHGTEKCLNQPETIELVLGVVPEVFMEKVGQIETYERDRLNAINEMERHREENKKLKEDIKKLQDKLALK